MIAMPPRLPREAGAYTVLASYPGLVFGVGSRKAEPMLVGEQPGDREEAVAALVDDLRLIVGAMGSR
jgi:hypothetical protein